MIVAQDSCDDDEGDKDDTCCHHIYTSIFILFMKSVSCRCKSRHLYDITTDTQIVLVPMTRQVSLWTNAKFVCARRSQGTFILFIIFVLRSCLCLC